MVGAIRDRNGRGQGEGSVSSEYGQGWGVTVTGGKEEDS